MTTGCAKKLFRWLSRAQSASICPIQEQVRQRTKPITLELLQCSAHGCICCAQAANGVHYPVTFPNGALPIRILPHGAKSMRKEKVCWSRRKKISLARSRKKQGRNASSAGFVDSPQGVWESNRHGTAVWIIQGKALHIRRTSYLHCGDWAS